MIRISQRKTLIYLSVYRYILCILFLNLKKYSGLKNQFYFSFFLFFILTPVSETPAKTNQKNDNVCKYMFMIV